MTKAIAVTPDAGENEIDEVLAPRDRILARRMIAIAVVMQNCSTGLTFGSFGAIVLAIQSHYSTTRTLASFGLSAVVLVLSLSAALVGATLPKVTIRRMMIAGIVTGGLGYLALAVAPNIWFVLGIYACVIGPSLAMFGVLVSSTLASNWSPGKQGRALGLVNMPLMVMVMPLISIAVVNQFGLQALFFGIAAVHLLILPLASLIVDRPADEKIPMPGDQGVDARHMAPVNSILSRPAFWLVTLGIGIIVGVGIMKIQHLVPLIVSRGRSAEQGSLLLAISGGTGVIGSLAFGWIADRIGGARALAANGLIQAATWFILLLPVGLPLLVVDAVLSGMCGGGASSAQGVLIARVFGVRSFSRVYGLLSLATVPFLFGSGPLVAYLFDANGDYFIPVIVVIAALILTLPIFGVLAKMERGSAHLKQTPEAAGI